MQMSIALLLFVDNQDVMEEECSLFTQSFLYASAFSFVPFKLFFVLFDFRSLFDLCLWMANYCPGKGNLLP